jgi:broad specificity phosphatase PhoE
VSRLLLIRHGETAHNGGGRLSTAAPGGPLTELGRDQAERLAESLAATRLEGVYTSPLVRARQTAEAIARRQGLEPLIRIELAEISTGELDGRSDPEAFAALNQALDAWCRGEYAVRIGDDGDLGSDVCDRFGRLVEEIAALHPSGTTALVSHGGLILAGSSWLAANLPPGFAVRRFVANTGIVELEVNGREVRCVSWDGMKTADPIGLEEEA